MKSLSTYVFLFLIVLFLASSCDDGGGKPCGWGSSYVPISMRTKWTINGKRLFLGQEISFDTCADVEATYVSISITGPENFVHTNTISCSDMEYFISDDKCKPFPIGPYTVEMTLLDAAHQPLTQVKTVTHRVTNDGYPPDDKEIDFDLESFLRSYTGTLWYKFTWNGASCAAAEPPVTTMEVALYNQDGVRETLADYTGTCYPDHTVQSIPTGDYTLRVAGRDDQGSVNYCGTMEVRIGAGPTNPAWELDVTKDATECASFVP